MPRYSYSQPSLGSDSIRLLRLMPNKAETAPIQCQLYSYPLQKSDKGTHLYEALSNVWGSSDNSHHSVFIDDCDLPITVNLHKALLHLRDRSFERIIWVDYVCINQDEQEKGRQIQSMAKIYGQANRVIVYLGEAADDKEFVLCVVRFLLTIGSILQTII